LVLVLAFVALASLRPWEDDSADPHLSLSPEPGAVGDAVAVTPDRSPRPAGVGSEGLARAVSAVKRVPPATDEPGPTLAVAQGWAVSTAAAPLPAPPAPTPELPASGQPAPPSEVPSPSHTVVTGNGDGADGPSTAVVEVEPKPGCEGDEYEITIGFVAEAVASEEAEVEIVIRRVGRDGSESEIQLEGMFGDVGDLLDQVASEGDCVAVRVEPAGEEVPADGFSEPPVATASGEEELEPVLP
jgi:hypothetical protein